MIKLSYKVINDPMFVNGLRSLVNSKFDLKTSYWIGRIQEKVMDESREAQKAWHKIMNERVEWEGEGAEKKPKDLTQLKTIEDEFLSIEFDMGKINAIHVDKIQSAKLSPLEIMSLQPILAGLETLIEGDSDEKSDDQKSV